MLLIGIVETRYFSGPHELAVRVQNDDGSYFDLPVTLDQASTLLAQTGAVRSVKRRPAPPASPVPAGAAPLGFDDDEDDGVAEIAEGDSIRLARFPTGGMLDEDDAL